MEVKVTSTKVGKLFNKNPYVYDEKKRKEYTDKLRKYGLKEVNEDAYIEVDTIKQLIDIIKETDELVVSYDKEKEELEFEIYDTYRE